MLADRYEIAGVLGSGGVGVVYRARQLGSGAEVAIKLLHPDHAANATLRQRFEREATALAEVAHPNIVRVTDYGVSAGTPFIVMELLHGQTLEERLAQEGPLAPARAIEIVSQALSGLAFAHARGLVHRDLKPANVFLEDANGDVRVRVLDFGLAKSVAGARSSTEAVLTKAGSVFGTPAYMAPEQTVGDEMDARTDVYAVGVILFEMLAGVPPYTGKPYEIAHAHLASPIPTLREKRSDVAASQELSTLFERALAKEPEERFADAGEMLAAVRALRAPPVARIGEASSAGDVWARATHATADGRPPRAKRGLGVAMALLVAALIAGGVALVVLGGPERSCASSPAP